MSLHSEIAAAKRLLEQAGIDPVEAAVDADLLARHVLGWDRARLLASLIDPPPPGFDAAYATLVARRQRREPAAYIVGGREFWRRDFEVGPGVLVPRPETESIVEEAIARCGAHAAAPHREHPLLVADVGTGSGCLAVTLAAEFPGARVVATDTSRTALAFARRNAARHDVSDRIEFVETDLLADVDARFDLIVSNPPYVRSEEMERLPDEVRDYEPKQALLGGRDGLDVIRRLLLQSESRLCTGGLLIFEFGFGQEAGVRDVVGARPAFRMEAVRSDLQRIPRTAVVQWHPPGSEQP